MDGAPEEFRQLHLQASQSEQTHRVGRISLNEYIDVAVWAEPIGQNRPEQVRATNTRSPARRGDAVALDHDAAGQLHRIGFYARF